MQTQVKCPSNVYLCNNEIYNILKKIKDSETNLKCSNIFCNKNNKTNETCDCLLDKIVSGNLTCTDIYGILNNETNSEIKNQIKYNLNQLIQLKLKLKAIKTSPSFGTYDWWEQNIWGANKIQNYIYIVSFSLAAIGVIYFTWKLFKETFLNFDKFLGTFMTTIGFVLMIAFILIFTVIFMDYSFSESSTYSKPSGSYAEQDTSQYPSNVQNNFQEVLTTSKISWMVGIPAGIMVLILGLITIWCFFGKGINSKLIKWIGYFALFLLMAYIIIFNIYFAFLIPQLLIIGVILQRFIFRTSSQNITLYYFLIPLVIFVTYVSYVFIINRTICIGTQQSGSQIDECTGQQISQTENNNLTYWLPYLFLTITLIILGIYAIISKREQANLDDDSWGLYLSPLVKIICHCINRKK